MGGYPVWQVTNYLFRSEEELKCDKYISERWIFMDRVSVVAEWANSGATGVRAPEIASDSKLGCLREGGRMQELGGGAEEEGKEEVSGARGGAATPGGASARGASRGGREEL